MAFDKILVSDFDGTMTAVKDWKLAFHHQDTPVDDFAALLSDASVFQFMGRPDFNLDGMQRLATALMLNGISMDVCTNSLMEIVDHDVHLKDCFVD